MNDLKIKTAFGSIFFISLGAIVWWQSLNLSVMGAVFPRVVSITMMLTSVLIILRMLLSKAPLWSEATREKPKNIWRGILLVMTIGIWLMLFRPLGMILSSILAFAVLMLIAEQDELRPLRTTLILIGGAIGIFAVTLAMTEVLMIPVPKGILS
ncbi:tripartite tricarboxylate transporter TctB family protein [Halomonas sp. MCCC 1A11036]|uniref:Tripartite tricarboxylate transporter TctB family protein n=1 Tax=Billgrantia zhangzhouensis TaxID=2733481 RepID=A0ABS9A9K8_9GAMM|nr:tripartite tricarboxylate transporter TctB family protein [Halomonas zhangzhouensis]MCE8018578.1 tripartite tricarboxylate transporter TctB family protein [Halomonas zhangzhouensis]